jgi:hypothetical protein
MGMTPTVPHDDEPPGDEPPSLQSPTRQDRLAAVARRVIEAHADALDRLGR